MTMIRLGVIWFVLVVMTSISCASNDFLYESMKMVGGIRAMGMANVAVAVPRGASALFMNPAGLALKGAFLDYEMMDYDQLLHRRYDQFSMSMGSFGFGHITREVSNGDNATITYYGLARKGKGRVDWGVSYKRIDAQFGGVSVDTYSCDVGMVAYLSPRLKWGVVVQDFLKRDLDLEPTLATGLAWNYESLLLAVDVVQHHLDNDSYLYARYGMEYRVADGLFVRVGNDRQFGMVGFTLTLPVLELDYAMKRVFNSDDEATYYLGFRLGDKAWRNR